MTSTLRVPVATQPVVAQDSRGSMVFTRPWFLFFQSLYQNIAGNIDQAVSGSSDDITQAPPMPVSPEQVDATLSVQSEYAEMRSRLAELEKEIQALKQGAAL